MIFSSCGFDAQENRDNAILTANIQLGSRNCDEALDALNAAPFSWKDATFLKTLSLSHACKGKFDVITLFTDDLPLFGTVADSAFGGLTRFSSSSDMESPTDNDYESVQTALDYLLYAGGISKDEDPTPVRREANFGEAETQEIEMLAFYELLVNLGRFLNYYGNTGSDGAKGGGAQANKCFIVYDDLPLENTGGLFTLRSFFDGVTPLGRVTGSCTEPRSADSGHEFLYNTTNGERSVERLCEGVVLINNFFGLLPRVLGSVSGADFDDVSDIESLLEAQLLIVEGFKAGTTDKVGNVLSHELCVSKNAGDDTYLQFYYAFIVEVLLR